MDSVDERMIGMSEISIWHVANAGVIIKLGDFNIGIDILCDRVDPYKETPEYVEKQVLDLNSCPSLDYVFITHEHPDHFNRHKIIEFLTLQPQAEVISNETVIEDLSGKIDTSRLISVSNCKEGTTQINHKGIEMEVFHGTHMGMQYKNVMNLCMIITWEGKKILIPGDADPRELLSSDRLVGQSLDLMIVPFPYITLNSVRKLLKESIAPEKLFVIHLPSEDKDHSRLIRQSKEIYKREAGSFPGTIFGECLGEKYNLYF